MSLSAHFQRLFEYEARCTALVAASLREARERVEDVSLASLSAPMERAVAVFCHVQAARRVWLHRLDAGLAEPPADGIFPVWPLDRAVLEAEEMDRLWVRYAAAVSESGLARPVAYTSTEGVRYESVVHDVLTQVVTHSAYHRGQIASLIAATGTKPAVTDYIAHTRRTV